jgi:hypothetical protein
MPRQRHGEPEAQSFVVGHAEPFGLLAHPAIIIQVMKPHRNRGRLPLVGKRNAHVAEPEGRGLGHGECSSGGSMLLSILKSAAPGRFRRKAVAALAALADGPDALAL